MQTKPLITLDDVLLRYCSRDQVVTANERLATALIDAYDQHHSLHGSVDYPPARVATLTDYLRARYAALSSATGLRTLLSADAQRLVWLEHTPDVSNIDLTELYPRVADAWRVMHDWRLTASLEQFDDNENHRLFRDWSQTYMRTARLRGWVTEAELPATIALALREGMLEAEALLLVGFDVIPPSLEHLINTYRSVGVRVELYEPARRGTASVTAISCNEKEQELRAATDWARTALEQGTEPKSICIAVPDLVESHDRVVRQLDAILRPDEAEPNAANSPYNVSGGVPLSTVPVVADALDLLDWLFEPYHHSRVDSLLRSPFLDLAGAAIGRRSRQPERCDAARFATLISASPLREIVQRASRMGLVDLSAACSSARQLLSLAGWPQPTRLSSESFQAYQSFVALLEELSANADVVQPRNFAATIRQFRVAADRRLFAPERPKAVIQVLGYLETIGLEFTHLWVTGLSRLDWPGAPSPTPFIPIRHLRAAAVPRTDVNGEIAFARRLMGHWRASATWVVFSYPRVCDDVPSQRSTLVDECEPSVERHLDASSLALSHPYLVGRPVAATRDDVSIGPAPIERLRHRGTGILRDQSACPFRAFARYRLHAPQSNPPHSFPDAADRGTATHAALRNLFDRLDPEIEFDRVDEAALGAAVSDAASTAIAVLGPLPMAFRDSERSRLTTLLLEWLQLERTRQPHRIVATETTAILSIGGIDFDLRIDRIDASPHGDAVVLDYKTGPTSPNVVIGARLEEPQLPMYALSTAGATAIAFACIRRNDCRLVGWSTSSYSASQNAERIRFNSVGERDDDWNALLDDWRLSLAALATEFRTGVSDVRPRDANACGECNLHALCRIREIRRVALD